MTVIAWPMRWMISMRALTLAVMPADSHYGCSDNMALTREREIDLVVPARPAKGASAGRLTLEDFVLDEKGLVLLCPNWVKPVSPSAATVKLQARFNLSICRQCPYRERCQVQATKRDGQFARFQYTPERVANQKRRLYERSEAFLEIYQWRAGIKATMSRLKKPDETREPAHSWYVQHALSCQSARIGAQHPPLCGRRIIKCNFNR